MQSELPDHLKATAGLLSESLRANSIETAPAIPSELLGDLTKRFSPVPANQAAPEKSSWIHAALSFCSSPAFGIASVAAIVAIFAIPALTHTEPEDSVFRGTVTTQTDANAPSIILIGAPDGTLETLQASGNFEPTSFANKTALSSETPKVVVDFDASVILAIDSSGQTVSSTEIPATAEGLSDAIAIALTTF